MSLTCRIHGAKDLRLDHDAAAELGPTDVEMRLGAGGICGSDLHYYQHGRVGAFVVREPLIPGHEVSGTVARIGAGVTRVKVGDKVAINPSHACGHCDYCNSGRLNLCRHMRFLGSASVFPHVQGMFRERFVMGERQLTPIHEDISLGELACAEPLSIGLHAVHRAGNLTGKTVLVTGGGTIGCMSVIAAKRMTRAFLPGMLESGAAGKGLGSIINVASVAGSIKGAPNRFVYGATKAAVIGMTKSIAADFITKGVRCNAICPGTVESPSLRDRMAALAQSTNQTMAQAEAWFVARQPMGRVGTTAEIAALAVYLASDESAFTTGTAQVIDGGWSN
ncbi:MAG: SDR family oxidoreductase [Pseudomonadota bacterium]